MEKFKKSLFMKITGRKNHDFQAKIPCKKNAATLTIQYKLPR